MSYVPNRAMKHAHTEHGPAEGGVPAHRHDGAFPHPPLWTMAAAGVAGAVATALFLSLRSSSRAERPAPRRRGGARKKKAG